VTPLLAYLAMVVAVAALCCGHQGERFPIRLGGPWRALRRLGGWSGDSADTGSAERPSGGLVAARATAAAPRRALGAPQTAEHGAGDLGAADAGERRPQPRRAPSWANTQPIKEN
jgi:hypothetical protein